MNFDKNEKHGDEDVKIYYNYDDDYDFHQNYFVLNFPFFTKN